MSKHNLTGVTPQTLTTSFADIGTEIRTKYNDRVSLWLKIVIGSGVDPTFRIACKHTSSGDKYYLPIQTISSSKIDVSGPENFVIAAGITNIILPVNVDDSVEYVQLEGKIASGSGTTVEALISSENDGSFNESK